jgi:Ca-activated chloride channel family protein
MKNAGITKLKSHRLYKVAGFLSFMFMLSCSSGTNREYTTEIMLEAPVVSNQAVVLSNGDTAGFNTEEYNRIIENPFLEVRQNPLSTFSIDVDKASYSNVRRFLTGGQLPPPDAVRIEEMINYFQYNYAQPQDEQPFSIGMETSACPWNMDHLLVRIGLQGKSPDYEHLKPSNLVFLIDVSGSMDESSKLPLVKQSLELMLKHLQASDRVALVVYAGAAGLVLPSTPLNESDKIRAAIKRLSAGGSTAGGEGLELAYSVAKENYLSGGNNRVILCTDGDFNVGVSSTSELVRFIGKQRKEDIYLTICGFGMGNLKDGRLEEISRAGNGNYFYIDREKEAEKVFGRELMANLFTIARDVKIQIEFNPEKIDAYRLIGYENRMLNKEDFNDDTKDAGELGAGHTVTALYELVPHGKNYKRMSVDSLKYQTSISSRKPTTHELLTIKLRYKPLDDNTSKLVTGTVDEEDIITSPSVDFRFAAGVAEFGMLLRQSEYKGDATFQSAQALVKSSLKADGDEEEKEELVELIRTSEKLSN